MRIQLASSRRLEVAPYHLALAACGLLALIGFGGGLLFGPDRSLFGVNPATLLPPLTAVLAVAAGLITLRANRSMPAAALPVLLADPPSDMQTILTDLRALLAEERRDAAAMREQCAATGHEALLVGARLAGAALDAETRLTTSVGQAEQAMQNPAGALARTAAATRRVERALTDLTETMKQSEPAADDSAALASRVLAMAEQAEQSLKIVIADLSRQITTLSQLAPAADLQQEAAALRSTAADAAVQIAEALLHAARSIDHLHAGLPAITGELLTSATSLRLESTSLTEIAVRLEAAAPGLDRLDAISHRLARLSATLPPAIEELAAAVPASLARMASEASPMEARQAEAFGKLIAVASDIAAATQSLEAAGRRQARAAEALTEAVAQVFSAEPRLVG